MSTVRTRTIGQGKQLRLVDEKGWEYAVRLRGRAVVAVIAVTGRRELVLTEQYRVPVHRRVIDLPAGLAGDIDGEESEPLPKAARRELLEETGYRGRRCRKVAFMPSSPGLTSEMVNYLYMPDVRKVAPGGGDESEDIEVHLVPLKDIHTWLKKRTTRKTCVDPKVLAAIGLLANLERK